MKIEIEEAKPAADYIKIKKSNPKNKKILVSAFLYKDIYINLY